MILLTNDDGYGSSGLMALESAMRRLGRVVIVAPADEKSAISHGVTIHHPLSLIKMGEDRYALTGTPADCVIFALSKVLSRRPDFVVSGINNGPNLGDDIHYSGTVAGAREASFHGIPAMAASLVSSGNGADFKPAAEWLCRMVEELTPQAMPAGSFWNVNVPEAPNRGYRFTRQGSRLSWGRIDEEEDPGGRKYYWIGRGDTDGVPEPDTDIEAVRENVVSITPLQHDHTDYRSLRAFLEKSRTS